MENSAQIEASPLSSPTKIKNASTIIRKIKKIKNKYQLNPPKSKPKIPVNSCSSNKTPILLEHHHYNPETIDLIKQESISRSILSNPYLISQQIRAKMVDWMIQVLNITSMSERTFFLSVRYMDLFLFRWSKPLAVQKFHLLGITAMFCASKFEEISPLSIAQIYTKIGHQKFVKKDIILSQKQLLEVIDYQLNSITLLDCLNFYITENMNICMPETASLKKICLYLAKSIVHFQNSLGFDTLNLSICILYIGLRLVSKNNRTIKPDYLITKITDSFNIDLDSVQKLVPIILKHIKDFRKDFVGLKNLQKFHGTIRECV